MKIGKTIASIREERSLKQKELAAISKLSTSFISEIENDNKKPDMDTLLRICGALNVPIQIFFLKATMEAEITDPDKRRLVREIKPLLNELTATLYPSLQPTEPTVEAMIQGL